MTAVKFWIVLLGELLCASAIAQADLSVIMQAQAMKERAEARFQQRMQICNSYIMEEGNNRKKCADVALKALQVEVSAAVRTMNSPAAKDEPKTLWESPSHNMFIAAEATKYKCHGVVVDKKQTATISGLRLGPHGGGDGEDVIVGWIFNKTGQPLRSVSAKIDGKAAKKVVAAVDGNVMLAIHAQGSLFSNAKTLEILAQYGDKVVEKTFDLADLPSMAENLTKLCNVGE